jgi:hypothetical protein
MIRARRSIGSPWQAILIVAAVLVSQACGPSTATMTPESWRADLHTLAQQLPARHVDPFLHVSRDSFEHAVARLDAAIPRLPEHRLVLELGRLVAMIGDGHTSFFPGDQNVVPFDHAYPLRLYAFEDGVHVIAAAQGLDHLVGRRLVGLGRLPVDSVLAVIAPYIARDNNMELLHTAPDLLMKAEVLSALGIADSVDRVRFTFANPPMTETLHALREGALDSLTWHTANPSLRETSSSPSLRALFGSAWTRDHGRGDYWFAPWPERGAVYLQYNRCWDQTGRPTFARVVDSLFAYLDHHRGVRLVIDVRQNPGGAPRVARPLIDGILTRGELMQPGRVLVLVGRRTFSAALTNVCELRRRAHASTVGERPRGKPNSPSEGRDLLLPRSRAHVAVSTQWVRRYPELGDAPYLPIDIPLTPTFTDYRRGIDAALDTAMEAR